MVDSCFSRSCQRLHCPLVTRMFLRGYNVGRELRKPPYLVVRVHVQPVTDQK